jgi:hypothetical protein
MDRRGFEQAESLNAVDLSPSYFRVFKPFAVVSAVRVMRDVEEGA